jgi:asparagine synthase (glutamine-hydrolysing)
MCAINGITENNHGRVAVMNERTRHRGPDGSRVWEGKGVTLGHNRLAIIDLSDRALQPMKGASGRFSIVFNGELYNYRELKEELRSKGYRFNTESDTEVLLVAFEEWGEAMFPKLRGMFAFGIWDETTETLTLARDHLGIKPLYFREKDGVLAFSSELSAFTGENNVLDSTALSLYLEFQYVPSPHTLVRGVEKLAPGHVLTYKNGVRAVGRYYAPENGTGVPEIGKSEALVTPHELYETIDGAVGRQLVSDRPIGMFLSGGLDSSIVLHHMSLHTRDVRTFSVGFEMAHGAEHEHEKFNADAHLAERTATHYGAKHTTYTLTLADVRNDLESILASLDEPVANPTAVAQHFLSKKVREDGVVVALGGDGGDELFLGYTRHRMLMAAQYFQRLPNVVQKLLTKVNPRMQKLMTPQGAAFHVSIMANKEKSISSLLKNNLHSYGVAENYFNTLYATLEGVHDPIDAFMYVDRATWLPDESLHRSDRTSMAYGLELRVPLIDLSVVTLADRIPGSKKVTPFEGKRFLRDTYRSYLPEYLFSQPKRGWVSPGAKWLRDPAVLGQVETILSPEYYDGLRELYDFESIQDLLRAHVDKRTYALYPLWNLLALQVWAKKHGVIYEG